MQPSELFALHNPKALRVASRLCWHYRISGAQDLGLPEDAAAEASMALWKECVRFQPRKQSFARAEDRRHLSDVYWSIVRKQGLEPRMGETSDRDPYRTFWMFASTRVHGAVIDFFRAQKIIQRLPRSTTDVVYCERCGAEMADRQAVQECEYQGFCRAPATLLHHEQFLSASKNYGEAQNGSGECCGASFFDAFPSRDHTDQQERFDLARDRLMDQARNSRLTPAEMTVVWAMCRRPEVDQREIGWELDKTEGWVIKTLATAAAKMSLMANKVMTLPPIPQAIVDTIAETLCPTVHAVVAS